MNKIIIRRLSEIIKKTEKSLRISHEKHLSITETGYFSNSPVTIDNRNNEIADRVINSGKISVSDKDLLFKSVDIETMKVLGPDFLQTDLGKTQIYSNDQILLEDVDPNNIPYDKEIIFWGKKAKIIAIGQPVNNFESRNIEQAIFHENKANHGVGYTWKTYMKLSVLLLPFFYYFTVYLEIIKEYYYVKSFYDAVDRENIELLKTIKNIPDTTIKTQKLLEKFYPNTN